MRQSFLPSTDAGLLAWSANFSSLISAEPVLYGLTSTQATSYASLHSAYSSAYTIANSAPNRTTPAIVAKNTARKNLMAGARALAAIVQATATVSDAAKSELRLTIRKTHPTPVPAPTVRPGMMLVSAIARAVTVRIYDSASSNHRGKPANVIGAKVYTFIGSDYPADPTYWAYQGDSTRFEHVITFPDSVPSGAQVWVCAAWYNRKGETGPISVPISTNVQGGGSSEEQGMKIAA